MVRPCIPKHLFPRGVGCASTCGAQNALTPCTARLGNMRLRLERQYSPPEARGFPPTQNNQRELADVRFLSISIYVPNEIDFNIA